MVIFLIAGKGEYGIFDSLREYHFHKPFEAGSSADIHALQILDTGNKLRVAYHENDEQLKENVRQFDLVAREYVKMYTSRGMVCGSPLIVTKGMHVDTIQMLLNYMMDEGMCSVLYLNPIVGMDLTVNPYGANKLE